MDKLSHYFRTHFSKAFKVAFTVVFILVNVTVVLVNTIHIRNQMRMQNDSLVEMVEHLSTVEDEETVITYLTHYGHTHRVFLRYATIDGQYSYETAVAPEDYEMYTVMVGGEEVAELSVDNAQSDILMANATYLTTLNVVLVAIYAGGMLYFHRRNKRLNAVVLEDLSAVQRRIEGRHSAHAFRIEDFQAIDNALEEAFERLQKLQESHRRHIRTLAHDIRTPLTILKGTLEGIREGRLQDQDEAFDSAAEGAVRIDGLIERIMYTDERQSPGNASLSRIILERLQAHRALFERKGLSLRHDIAEGVTLGVSGEEAKRLIEHLLLNAYNHTPEGGLVKVVLTRDPTILTVTDDGEGMDEKTRRTLFDGDRPQRGIGMLIVKDIVDRTDGEIEIESRVNEGTEIRIRLGS